MGLKSKALEAKVPEPVSVIICARNEEENLSRHLVTVLEQDYPEFEVVVVNDCSYDASEDVLKEYALKYKHLKVITVKEDENHEHGKKFALMVGIKGAKYEQLAFTDADCMPSSNQWLKNLCSHFSDEKKIVLGYGGYEKLPGLLNKVIRYDTFYIALQYLGFAALGLPYMGIGRNMAYKKTLFFKNKGFAGHYHIQSGDDDLFINEVATGKNVSIEVSPESLTTSKVKRTFQKWIRQKRRHLTTFKYYSKRSRAQLFILGLSQYLFFISFVILLAIQFEPYIAMIAFGVRLTLQFIIFNSAMKKLKEKDLLILAPLLEIGLMLFYPIFSFGNIFVKKSRWTKWT